MSTEREGRSEVLAVLSVITTATGARSQVVTQNTGTCVDPQQWKYINILRIRNFRVHYFVLRLFYI